MHCKLPALQQWNQDKHHNRQGSCIAQSQVGKVQCRAALFYVPLPKRTQ
mgnify:CR=1 FL=1